MTPPSSTAAAGEHLSIRMYRGLLGDCFLLTHSAPDRPEPFRALIDCGVLQCIGKKGAKKATEQGLDQIQAVATNLVADTGGVLDLVIATHEHFDHLSGFMVAFDILKDLTIRTVWMAWTEKPGDMEADALRQRGIRGLKALEAALNAGEKSFGLDDDRVHFLENMLQFYGKRGSLAEAATFALDRASKPMTVDTRPKSCRAALEWLKLKAGHSNVRYLDPGEVVRFGLGERLTAHVLGPPRSAGRLAQLDPSPGSAREVYLTSRDEVNALETTLDLMGFGGKDKKDPRPPNLGEAPFFPRFNATTEEIRAFSTYKLYWPKEPENRDAKAGKAQTGRKTRRIDDEWFGSVEHLALKIDGDVNNTSLALAIELPGRDVLLFPGDAQVGNWLSWHDQTYPKGDTAGIKAADLLNRTILYKVGHHGSHNATARDKGL